MLGRDPPILNFKHILFTYVKDVKRVLQWDGILYYATSINIKHVDYNRKTQSYSIFQSCQLHIFSLAQLA